MSDRRDSTWFHGTVHPTAGPTSVGINYSLEDLRKCCAKLPGTPLAEYHEGESAGKIVHAYIGDDNALHAVGEVCGDGFQAAVVQVMLERGLLNALSLAQQVAINTETGRVRPVGDPVNVGLVHIDDAGRGPTCVIDAHAKWAEIEELMRPGNGDVSVPKNPAGILRAADPVNPVRSNPAKRRLAELVWKTEMEKAPTATTPAPAQPAQTTQQPAAAAQPVQETVTLSPEHFAEALKQATATIKQLKGERDDFAAKLKASSPQGQQSLKERTKVLSKAMHNSFESMYTKAGRKIPPSVEKVLATLDAIDDMQEEELARRQPEVEALCAASADGCELAQRMVEAVAEIKQVREDNDRMKRDVFSEFRNVMGTVGSMKQELTSRGLDFTTKLEVPPAKRQAVETAAPAPAAAPAPTQASATAALFPDLWAQMLAAGR
jgi:hypothetical protein